jgi:hypothetical protein
MHDLACIEILDYIYHMKKHFVAALGLSVWTLLIEYDVLKRHFHFDTLRRFTGFVHHALNIRKDINRTAQ